MKPLAVTTNDQGVVITEHHDGFDWPRELTFDAINDFVHGRDVQYENLQSLCLALAAESDKWRQAAKDASRAGTQQDAIDIVDKASSATASVII